MAKGDIFAGGGSSAEIPDYMKSYHQYLLTGESIEFKTAPDGSVSVNPRTKLIGRIAGSDETSEEEPVDADYASGGITGYLEQAIQNTNNPYSLLVEDENEENKATIRDTFQSGLSNVVANLTNSVDSTTDATEIDFYKYTEALFDVFKTGATDPDDALSSIARESSTKDVLNGSLDSSDIRSAVNNIAQVVSSQVGNMTTIGSAATNMDAATRKMFQGNLSNNIMDSLGSLMKNIFAEVTTIYDDIDLDSTDLGTVNKVLFSTEGIHGAVDLRISNIITNVVSGTLSESLDEIRLNLVNTYRTRLETQQGVNYGKIAARLASVGGANASAMVNANILLTRDMETAIEDYEAKLRNEHMDLATRLIGSLTSSTEATAANMYLTNYQSKLANLSDYFKSYLGTVVGTIQQAMQSSTQNLATITGANTQLYNSLYNLYGSIELSRSEHESALLLLMTQVMTDASVKDLDARNDLYKTVLAAEKLSYDTKNDYYINYIDLLSKQFTWPMDIIQRASNILAGPSGAVVNAEQPPSKFSQIAAGVTAGAGLIDSLMPKKK